MIPLHFLHTNDIHSHFDSWGCLVSYLNQERKRLTELGEPFLTLDLGDHMDRFNPLTEGLLGTGNVQLLNDADYDYVTIGNNEGITFTKEQLGAAYLTRRFKVVLANLYDQQTGLRPDWCSPYAIQEMHGVKVGLIGLTASFPHFYNQLGWEIKDPYTELKKIMQQLRGQVDVLVLMSHVGLPFDERVAREVAGIDVIIGAHTHHVLEQGELVSDTLIAQGGKYLRYAGHVVVEYDEQSGRIIHKGADLITLREPSDHVADAEVNHLTERGIAAMQDVVAVLDHNFPVDWFANCELTQLMADALRQWCDADIGLVNAGVILDDLNKGPLTRYTVHRTCPHPINPCRVEVTGKEIIEMIQIGLRKEFQTYELKGFGFRGKLLGRLVFSYLTYDTSAEEVVNVRIDGQPIDPIKRYSVGTIDMFTLGSFLPPIVKAQHRFYLPETLRDLLAWRLSQLSEC
ncbi:bifunctional metallophosphatase/5'-nucleotidase [Sporolactobacillus nakayamae]|uniref:2',3'-cyclic-nucleotide 2'-phosphodiesterase/5'-or 3'-nucleotidase, 5'-nucleotidase family n=1 Tax=Sporolactobacillus nakayamae TaxID=269670 RepID=A0A1I2VXM3_9BACL|nr:bifunctional UDP-sugar hydrolase/5'-nucleotidase [Sporolactobacillus nakayamae]SFG93067.1 2',3'-cyclic-nucleotide 2'-phosphodiesterase/5'-or 3'-nucleotidase, 5'-nucleotidase family [Sporolactobacillus nakayamae]